MPNGIFLGKPEKEKEKSKPRVLYHDKSMASDGHMAQLQTCDCNSSAKQKFSSLLHACRQVSPISQAFNWCDD